MKTLAAVAAAAAVAAIVAATASGAPPGRTIKLIELPGGSFNVVDNPPKTTHTTQGEPRAFSGGDIVRSPSRPRGRARAPNASPCSASSPGPVCLSGPSSPAPARSDSGSGN